MTMHLVAQARTPRCAPADAAEAMSSPKGTETAFDVSIARRSEPDTVGLPEDGAALPSPKRA